MCARQEFALRGHDKSTKSHTRGNFLEILHLIISHDPILTERRLSNPQNATYLSPDIQNQLLGVMGSIARDEVALGDETKDVSKVEQLAIVIRYVHCNAHCLMFFFLRPNAIHYLWKSRRN